MPSIKEIFDTMEYSPAPESDNVTLVWSSEYQYRQDEGFTES